MPLDKAAAIVQYTERMRACIDNLDKEEAHAEADSLIVGALMGEEGWSELIDLYEQVEKGYI